MDWSNNASLKQQVVLPIRTINKGSLFTEKNSTTNDIGSYRFEESRSLT